MNSMVWKCCDRTYSNGIKVCRVCGKDKPTYGIVEKKVTKPARNKVTTPPKPKPKKATKRRSRDPLISHDENKLYVSTLLTKDGKTAEDLKKEREHKIAQH